MSNALYQEARQRALKGINGTADVVADDIRCILVDLADYTFSAAHNDLADVPAAARVAVSPALTGITNVDGVIDVADFTFSAVTGDESEALIFYFHTGTEGTSLLLHYKDTGITGIPVTPNGGDIDVAVNASGLFSIGG